MHSEFRSAKYSTSTIAEEGNAVLMRRQSCVEAYAEDANHAQAPDSSFGCEKEGSLSRRRPNSLLVQPLTEKTNLLPNSGAPR